MSIYLPLTIATILGFHLFRFMTVGFTLNDFGSIDNIAYWISYRYWVEGVDLAGDIDYVRPILGPGILLAPFALVTATGPHAVWAFNASMAAVLSGIAFWYARTMGLSPRPAACAALTGVLFSNLFVQGSVSFGIIVALLAAGFLYQGHHVRAASALSIIPLVSPPLAAASAVLVLLHSSTIRGTAIAMMGLGVGSIVYMASTPLAGWEQCIMPNPYRLTYHALLAGIAFLAYRYFPADRQLRILLGISLYFFLTLGYAPFAYYHPLGTTFAKMYHLSALIVGVYLMRWRNWWKWAIVLPFLSLLLIAQLWPRTPSPDAAEIAAAAQGEGTLYSALLARNASTSLDYYPTEVQGRCWRNDAP